MADPGLEKKDLAPILQMVPCFPGCTITAVWPQEGTDLRFAYDETCCFGEEAVQTACYRLFIPDLLEDESRCLYLDCDTVICHPLTELYDTYMGSASIAGVTDRLCLKEDQVRRMEKEWGVAPGYYINAGVILMNLERMRDSGNVRHALELAYKTPFQYVDQDVLNQIYQGEVMLLPKQYNLCPKDNLQDMKAFRMLLPEYAGLFSDEALTDPVIVHYIGNNKPWSCSDLPLVQYWHEEENACTAFLKNFTP